MTPLITILKIITRLETLMSDDIKDCKVAIRSQKPMNYKDESYHKAGLIFEIYLTIKGLDKRCKFFKTFSLTNIFNIKSDTGTFTDTFVEEFANEVNEEFASILALLKTSESL
jgi:hypothetical protein